MANKAHALDAFHIGIKERCIAGGEAHGKRDAVAISFGNVDQYTLPHRVGKGAAKLGVARIIRLWYFADGDGRGFGEFKFARKAETGSEKHVAQRRPFAQPPQAINNPKSADLDRPPPGQGFGPLCERHALGRPLGIGQQFEEFRLFPREVRQELGQPMDGVLIHEGSIRVVIAPWARLDNLNYNGMRSNLRHTVRASVRNRSAGSAGGSQSPCKIIRKIREEQLRRQNFPVAARRRGWVPLSFHPIVFENGHQPC